MSERIKTTPFRAIDYIKTQKDLDIYTREVCGWSFRAGQEDMKRRAKEQAQGYWPSSFSQFDVARAIEVRIASLEVRDE